MSISVNIIYLYKTIYIYKHYKGIKMPKVIKTEGIIGKKLIVLINKNVLLFSNMC